MVLLCRQGAGLKSQKAAILSNFSAIIGMVINKKGECRSRDVKAAASSLCRTLPVKSGGINYLSRSQASCKAAIYSCNSALQFFSRIWLSMLAITLRCGERILMTSCIA